MWENGCGQHRRSVRWPAMPEFPSVQEVLGDLVSLKSYTPEGRRAVTQYIVDFTHRWQTDLQAEAQLMPFPGGCNVIVDVGVGVRHASEVLLGHAHFDKVDPDDYPKNFDRDPDQLITDSKNPDICYGLGSYDMLGSVAGFLCGLRKLQLAKHRHLRILFADLEEKGSDGTHWMVRPMEPAYEEMGVNAENPYRGISIPPGKDLLHDIGPGNACLLSNEIPVGGSLDDTPGIYIGRTGRVGLHLDVMGEGMHSGKVRRSQFPHMVSHRESVAKLALEGVHFPEHETDHAHLMPESLCVARDWYATRRSSLSVPSSGIIEIDVFYTNPSITKTDIQRIVRSHLARTLGDDNFILTFNDRGRRFPFTKPWLELPNHPFVQHAQRFGSEVYNQSIPLRAASGVADEAIIVHAKNVPAICFPMEGQDEHIRTECVRISSITQRFIPLFHKLGAYDRSLTSWAA